MTEQELQRICRDVVSAHRTLGKPYLGYGYTEWLGDTYKIVKTVLCIRPNNEDTPMDAMRLAILNFSEVCSQRLKVAHDRVRRRQAKARQPGLLTCITGGGGENQG